MHPLHSLIRIVNSYPAVTGPLLILRNVIGFSSCSNGSAISGRASAAYAQIIHTTLYTQLQVALLLCQD